MNYKTLFCSRDPLLSTHAEHIGDNDTSGSSMVKPVCQSTMANMSQAFSLLDHHEQRLEFQGRMGAVQLSEACQGFQATR